MPQAHPDTSSNQVHTHVTPKFHNRLIQRVPLDPHMQQLQV